MRDAAGIVVFALAAAAAIAWLDSGVALNFVMMALYATLLAQAWNVLGGFGGQFSFGHALFFGTGAYLQVIAQVTWGLNAWAALPLAVGAAAAVGAGVGALTFRYGLKGSYFALVTLAFAEVFRILAVSVGFTGAAPVRRARGSGGRSGRWPRPGPRAGRAVRARRRAAPHRRARCPARPSARGTAG